MRFPRLFLLVLGIDIRQGRQCEELSIQLKKSALWQKLNVARIWTKFENSFAGCYREWIYLEDPALIFERFLGCALRFWSKSYDFVMLWSCDAVKLE